MKCSADDWWALSARSVRSNEWRAICTRHVYTKEWRAVSARHVVMDMTSRRACSRSETRLDNGLKGSWGNIHTHPLKHSYRHSQVILHLLMIPPRYSSVVRIKDNIPIPRHPPHVVLCLLRFAYPLWYHLHHRIHLDVENNINGRISFCLFLKNSEFG